jgi:outer membrane protein OmpA-like peptidoglycan-associated protein
MKRIPFLAAFVLLAAYARADEPKPAKPRTPEYSGPPPTSYRLEFLDVNSKKADFSPVFYRNGLVFCSARGDGQGLRRLFSGKDAFLDLYFLPDASALTGSPVDEAGNIRKVRRERERTLGSDEYTAPTANDTRTVGTFLGTQVTEGKGYGDRPESESARFSRTLNSKYHEGPATFTADGRTVVFTRNNYNNGQYRESSDKVNKLKLYTADLKGGDWTNVRELPFNSDEFSTGHPAFSPDNKTLYFVSDRPGGLGGTDLYAIDYQAGTWGKPRNLGPEVNTKGNEMFPFADARGNLYFASDGHPGLGNLDLFFVELKGGKPASKVLHLDAPFNSPQDDFGLVTDPERRSGFFSSNRRRGGTDDDLYRFTLAGSPYACRTLTVVVVDAATRLPLSQTVLAVEKAGSATEKQTADAGQMQLCLEENREYLFRVSHDGYVPGTVGFSTRGPADDAPSRLEIPLERHRGSLALTGRVTTKHDGQPAAGALVVLRSETDGSTRQALSGTDGRYTLALAPGQTYTVEAVKKGYGSVGVRLETPDAASSPDRVEADLSLFRKGDVVQLNPIHYDFNQWAIRPDAAAELDNLADVLKKYPSMRIELRSHTDTRASAPFNQTLSDKRARAAVEYLRKKGIAPSRMVPKGLGESQPLVPCPHDDCCEEAHQQNRRTEFRVVELK